jgi:hypothetical protein
MGRKKMSGLMLSDEEDIVEWVVEEALLKHPAKATKKE